MLTIEDLGVLRSVDVDESGHVHVTITPTYSGCPAMDTIRTDVVAALRAAGHPRRHGGAGARPGLDHGLDERGRQGEAPRLRHRTAAAPGRGGAVALRLSVRCPQCGSPDTRELSRFGSTACKSLWVCEACREPFDHFKAI